MFRKIAQATVHHPKIVLVTTSLVFIVAGVFGTSVIPTLSGGGYSDQDSDSAKVWQVIADDFKVEEPYLTLVLGNPGVEGFVDKPETLDTYNLLLEKVQLVDGVGAVNAYWTAPQSQLNSQLKSKDASLGLVMIYLSGESLDSRNELSRQIDALLPSKLNGADIYVGGTGAILNGINGQITEDIKFAEMVSIPLTMILLMFIFGTAVAAGMPLIVGVTSILGAIFGIWAVAQFTEVSVFSLNLITGLGLGLGIDYSLLVVNRFREELKLGRDVETAVKNTVHTAGRTVLYSGFTVAITLGSLVLFPQEFLKSFAYAGVLVCLSAIVGALVILPAALRVLGGKIDKYRVRRGSLAPSDEGVWSRVARFVMRHPWITLTATLAMLVSMMLPLQTAVFSQVDDRVLAKDHPAAIASKVLRDNFTSKESTPFEILFEQSVPDSEVTDFATTLSKRSDITRVETLAGVFANGIFTPLGPEFGWPTSKMETDNYVRIRAISTLSPRTTKTMDQVAEIRDLDPQAIVGGAAADFADSQNGIANQLPKVLLWIAIATFLILFLFTGSVLLPIKAVVLNVLSLGATMGLLTWMFQNGNLQFLTGEYTVTNTMDTSSMVLIAIVTFGLSMDYELFLLSRIKEEHDHGSNTEDAVALGLQRSGRIITAAAVLLAVVFGAFVTASVTNMKLLGFGIAFAILLDATVVRGLLVPALMRIAGQWNWWAPKPLRVLHDRFGLKD
jgi:RND superfamily putative drug exporter